MYDHRTTDLLALHIFKKQQLKELFDGDIPKPILECLEDNPRKDALLEWLNTRESNELIDKLHKEFGNDIVIDTQHDRDIDTIRVCKNDRTENIFISNKAKDIIGAYGYQFDKEDEKYIIYRPLTAGNVNDMVYGECHGVVYHITPRSNTYSILNNGIRAKSSGVRDYTNRVFCFVNPPRYNYNLKLSLDEVMVGLGWNDERDKLAIVKIDLNSRHVFDFYQDDAMMCDTACYTFSNIPKEYIKWIKPLSELC